MASSLINNTIQIYFDSVYGMADEGMVHMFKALESSGLHGFLGCSSAIFESLLVEFFQNASVRDDKVVSAVQGKAVEISEEVFAGTFEMPTEGLTDMIDVPKDLVFDARSAFSMDSQLKTVTVGTYVAKNKNITVEEVVDEPVAKKAAPKRRPAPAVGEVAAEKKRKTVGRPTPAEKELVMVPVVQNPEPISVVPAAAPRAQRRRAPMRKLVMQEGSDDEIVDNIIHQVIAETAEIETGEPDFDEPVLMETTETAAVETESRIDVSSITNYDEEDPLKSTSDEESMPIDDLLAQIPENMMLPSVTAADPTRIKFGIGIEIKGVKDGDCLRSLEVLETFSDIAAKEEHILAWAEIDSLQTAVSRCLYIVAKYREMLLQKFLEARNKNFESGTPTNAIDLQVLSILSDAHRVALEKLLKQMREHKLEWTRPIDSRLFEGVKKNYYPVRSLICMFIEPVQVVRSLPIVKTWGWARVCTDIVQFSLFGHLQRVGYHNLCTDLVAVGPVVDRSGIPKRTVNKVQYDIQIVYSFSVPPLDTVAEEPVVNISTDLPDIQRHQYPNFSSTSSYSESQMDFIVDIPHNEETTGAQIPTTDIPQIEQSTTAITQLSLPAATIPTTDLTKSFALLRTSVNQISLELLQTNDSIDDLKTNLSSRIYNLESVFADANTRHEEVFRGLINNAQQEEISLEDLMRAGLLQTPDHRASPQVISLQHQTRSSRNYCLLLEKLWRIRIPSPAGAAEAPGSDQFHEETGTSRDRNKSDHVEDGERRRLAAALGRADGDVCKRRWGAAMCDGG
ncbi:histone-lysine N-methyltransferase 2D-like [Dorcoceras hygrometricum]|uniref:Histone-lysine N-methyltransferase 2D-like n=1 Tax=Dorcoceras hygrometricum TaxID=472368 RepID=A0A2Z7CKL6_9LAMI|nr:histone-lysine N-methyltransferase 2D-like [Dorcoceras hygrometricum]